MVSESSTGYICNLEIYRSEETKLQETVLSVLQPYLDSWHHVYQDNYYNSVSTSGILLQNKIRVCGTIKENRGKRLVEKQLKEKSKHLQKDSRDDIVVEERSHSSYLERQRGCLHDVNYLRCLDDINRKRKQKDWAWNN